MKNLIITFLTSFALEVSGCDCNTQSLSQAFSDSDLIIKGKVVNVELKQFVVSPLQKDSIESSLKQKIFSDTINYYEYTFLVQKVFKNINAFEKIVIRSGAYDSNCEIQFKLNATYLLYAFNGDERDHVLYPIAPEAGVFYSSVCTRTTEKWRKEIRAINRIKKKNE